MQDREIILPGATIFFSWDRILETIEIEDTYRIFDYFLGELQDPYGKILTYLGSNHIHWLFYILVWPEQHTHYKNHKEIAEALVDFAFDTVDGADAINLKHFAHFILEKIKEKEKRVDWKLLK